MPRSFLDAKPKLRRSSEGLYWNRILAPSGQNGGFRTIALEG
ncbi:MAG: hypothetical protein QW220_00755 [Candidatus Bathyarchaeia archaeon]